ncbi:MAG: HlyD family efflux transporter periplasmic adaptor subunit, partial [Balneolaceae bacterium]
VLALSADIDSLQAWLSAGNLRSIRAFSLPAYAGLGELQGSFQSFEASWRELRSFLEGGIYLRQAEMLRRELSLMGRQLELLEEQKAIQQEDYERARREFEGQRRLAERGLLAPVEIARAESELASRRLPLQQTESSILSSQVSQAAKQAEILELERRIGDQRLVFGQALAGLRSAVDVWMRDYLLIAPLDGRVIHAGIIQQGQSLQAGQSVLYVRPEDTGYFGELQIAQESVGKIRPGQMVLVRLSGYPYHEYGTLEGRIDYLSEVPVGEEVFLGKVSFPGGFVTSYGRSVRPRGGMTGQAEIITDDMRLLERVYNNMRGQLR